jgi:hypothetical protein
MGHRSSRLGGFAVFTLAALPNRAADWAITWR